MTYIAWYNGTRLHSRATIALDASYFGQVGGAVGGGLVRCWYKIAAALRYHARDATRVLSLLSITSP